MEILAYKTETFTREVFNPDVCSVDDRSGRVWIRWPDRSGQVLHNHNLEDSAALQAMLSDWLRKHIDADRLTRKESKNGPDERTC